MLGLQIRHSSCIIGLVTLNWINLQGCHSILIPSRTEIPALGRRLNRNGARESTYQDWLVKKNSDGSFTRQAISHLPRGGSQERSALESFVSGLRNVSPLLASIVQSFIRVLEKMVGISLLPQIAEVPAADKNYDLKESVSQKSSKKKRKKKKTSEESDPTKIAKKEPKQVESPKKSPAQNSKSSKAALGNPTNQRIQRELKEFLQSPPPNLKVSVGKNLRIWIIHMKGAAGTIYEGETYKLRVLFPDRYPMVPPSMYFLKPTPRHEHVYTNGDICLSLFGKDWRPTLTAQSLAVSILSMLSSARSKKLPMDNARIAGMKPGQSQENWVYHDDNC